MRTVPLNKIFEIKYGNSLSLSDLDKDINGIPFISRTEKNNGQSAKVKINSKRPTNPKNTISVAVGGSVMSSFLQKEPYYTGYHILVLHPLISFTDNEMHYYCMCLKANKYRYSYGRQANKTLNSLLVPSIDSIPKWVNNIKIIQPSNKSLINKKYQLNIKNWQYFKYTDIFTNIEKCKCSNASGLLKDGSDIFYIGAKKNENGFIKKVELDNTLVTKGNAIVFIGDGQGSVGYTTYQPINFIGSTTLTVGYADKLNIYNALFLVTVLDLERYRYSFGRKYGKTIVQNAQIKLSTKNNQPNWQFMENYIKSLPYSKAL